MEMTITPIWYTIQAVWYSNTTWDTETIKINVNYIIK